MSSSQLPLPERMVAAAARGLTRRRLLRDASSAALGAAVTTAYLGRDSEVAAACTFSNICTPSPLCGDFRCSGFSCNVSSETKWAHWEGGTAPCSGNSGVDNCWDKCIPPNNFRCCDCCARNAGCTQGSTCFGCGSGTWHKCICRARIGSC